MRLLWALLLVFAASARAQDENSEDIFASPFKGDQPPDGDDDVESTAPVEEMNEGSDTFQMSTEMIEMTTEPSAVVTSSPSDDAENSTLDIVSFDPIEPSEATLSETTTTTAEEVKLEEPTTEPVTPIPSESEFLEETPEHEHEHELEGELTNSTEILNEEHEVAEKRVLKEKEDVPLPLFRADKFTPAKEMETTTPVEALVSDPSHIADDNEETPFDQSAAAGLFEQDGSVIDSSLVPTDEAPAFPIVQMKEEDTKFIGQNVTVDKARQPTTTPRVVVDKEEMDAATTTATSTSTTTTTEPTTSAQEELDERMQPHTDLVMLVPPKEASEASKSTTEDPTEERGWTAIANSSKVFAPAKGTRTPVTVRITSIDYNELFADLSSGPSRKLVRTFVPPLRDLLASILGDNLVDVEVTSFTKGSVIVHADALTMHAIADDQETANRLEAAIAKNGSKMADTEVDSLSVTVNGMASRAYLDSLANASVSSSISNLMLPWIVASVVLVVVLALLVILMMHRRRRRHGTMKLSDDSLVNIESAPSSYSSSHVHLMSYGSQVLVNGELPKKVPPACLKEREVV